MKKRLLQSFRIAKVLLLIPELRWPSIKPWWRPSKKATPFYLFIIYPFFSFVKDFGRFSHIVLSRNKVGLDIGQGACAVTARDLHLEFGATECTEAAEDLVANRASFKEKDLLFLVSGQIASVPIKVLYLLLIKIHKHSPFKLLS